MSLTQSLKSNLPTHKLYHFNEEKVEKLRRKKIQQKKKKKKEKPLMYVLKVTPDLLLEKWKIKLVLTLTSL